MSTLGSTTRWTPRGDPSLFDRVIPEDRWSYAACRLEYYEGIDPPLIEILRAAVDSAKLRG